MRFSLNSFLRFLFAFQLFVSLNYVLYLNSRAPFGEYAGWPFEFYLDWAGYVYEHRFNPLKLGLDIAIGLLFSCLFAGFRWKHFRAFFHRLRTWGTPWDDRQESVDSSTLG